MEKGGKVDKITGLVMVSTRLFFELFVILNVAITCNLWSNCRCVTKKSV